jgi:hypothetical protein
VPILRTVWQKKGEKIMQRTEEQWAKIYGQYLDTTADAIQNRVDDMQIVFYFLKDYELKGLEFETILEVDGRVEITLREIDSDEGGNHVEN